MIPFEQNRFDIKSGDFKKEFPSDPGVYIFRDSAERVIYVGKAKNIKNRVSSYFNSPADMTPKTVMMVSKARFLEFILTSSENEAFLLESSLIKKHIPRYNIVLRDDKQYPYLKIPKDEPYPRLEFVRKLKNDGAVYFGPYSSSGALKDTTRLINRIFRLRKCSKSFMATRTRPCLNYQLGRCLAPCTSDVSIDEYAAIVKNVRLFLEGRSRELVKQLETDMKRYAAGEKYEEAARVRDQIKAVLKTVETQNVSTTRGEDQDIIGVSEKNGMSQVVIFFSRKGVITGNRDFRFENKGVSPSGVIEVFLKQYYTEDGYVPKNILISHPIDESESISGWLSYLAKNKINIHHPVRGKRAGMVSLAVKNAESILNRTENRSPADILEMAKTALNLKKVPYRIEAMDISNMQGNQAVGTIVAFTDGRPHREGYRNFRIRDVNGIDDYGMMSEMVKRRLSHGDLPDLFVVDGGKGHLMAVSHVLAGLPKEMEQPALVAVAKEREQGVTGDKLYLPGRKNPLRLNADHPVLLMIMGIRDEVHRRAVTYHRKLRKKETVKSALDRIPGIGPSKRNLLLQEFGSLEAIRVATEDELLKVRGITKAMAVRIKELILTPEES
ncbi:MAG: excinuclease ABC subunit UvrC [Deltaproteobacteria bacterium]|nr:excinuclease ABC subunit UvrC [Deltaproteobacteria bacterium]